MITTTCLILWISPTWLVVVIELPHPVTI